MGRALLLLVVVVLQAAALARCAPAGFQSDELNEDEEEWGLVGGTSPPPPAPATARVTVDTSNTAGDASKVQFSLEHAFGGSEFTPAGTFTARVRPSSRGGQAIVKLRLLRNSFTEEEKQAFKDLLERDGLYSIRVPATPLNPGKTFVMSSTKARCLAAANLKERFDMYMEQGHVIAVGYNAGEECSFPRVLKRPTKWTFDSHIVSKGGEQASRTPVVNELDAGLEQKLGDEDLALKKPVEKSFWAKYWMYIVPLGLIVMNAITQVANLQDDQGGQQAAGAARGAVAARRR